MNEPKRVCKNCGHDWPRRGSLNGNASCSWCGWTQSSTLKPPSCKTCGGTSGNHVPSPLDANGVGDPGHIMPKTKFESNKEQYDIHTAFRQMRSYGLQLSDIEFEKELVKLSWYLGKLQSDSFHKGVISAQKHYDEHAKQKLNWVETYIKDIAKPGHETDVADVMWSLRRLVGNKDES